MRVTDERLAWLENALIVLAHTGLERETEERFIFLMESLADVCADLQDARAEIARLQRIVDAAEELTVDAGYTDKRRRTVSVNAKAYETFAHTLIDTRWRTSVVIEAEREEIE